MYDMSIVIAGAAGEGIQTIGEALTRCFLRHGYPVFTYQEYESRIRGGNNSYRLRVTESPMNAPRLDADILLALNEKAAAHYRSLIGERGWAITGHDADDQQIHVPFRRFAREAGSILYANSVAAGAICAAVGVPLNLLVHVLKDLFGKYGDEVVGGNTVAARSGYEAAQTALDGRTVSSLPQREAHFHHAAAHETIPLAAAAAGCRFISAYPMSPSTGIITAFARDPELGVFVEQTEDEIAAINMAIGASAAGVRAMTATSGGGFALMVEAISLAGMIETPIVIVLSQRPGPATGLPTRTAQEDLLFALHAGHGEFPKLLLAPSDPQDAIYKTLRAFSLADRYQIPVILLTDQFLADSHFTLEGLVIPQVSLADRFADPRAIDEYRRYQLTEDGISPRLYFGQSEHLVCLDSDEHTQSGHITEDIADVRPQMVEKRLEKGRRLKREIALPEQADLEDAETVLIGWGSTRNAIREAAAKRRKNGDRIGRIHFTEVWPLPDLALPSGKRYFTVEGNSTGQLAHLLRAEYGLALAGTIGRNDGLPLDAATIVKELS